MDRQYLELEERQSKLQSVKNKKLEELKQNEMRYSARRSFAVKTKEEFQHELDRDLEAKLRSLEEKQEKS